MSLRNRTPADPPPVGRYELLEKIEHLTSICSSIYDELRYLEYERDIDEQYKVHRTLVKLSDFDEAAQLATQLSARIEQLKASIKWVVHEPGRETT